MLITPQEIKLSLLNGVPESGVVICPRKKADAAAYNEKHRGKSCRGEVKSAIMHESKP